MRKKHIVSIVFVALVAIAAYTALINNFLWIPESRCHAREKVLTKTGCFRDKQTSNIFKLLESNVFDHGIEFMGASCIDILEQLTVNAHIVGDKLGKRSFYRFEILKEMEEVPCPDGNK